MEGEYVLQKGESGKFHFNLIAGNCEIIASIQHYDRKDSARQGIKSVQSNAATDTTLVRCALQTCNQNTSRRMCLCRRRRSHFSRGVFIRAVRQFGAQSACGFRQWRRICPKNKGK